VIRTASVNDLPALTELFRRANDAPYDLSVVAEEKCFGEGIAGAPVTRVFEEAGRVLGAAVSCGKYLRILAVDREFRGRGIGTALLTDAQPKVIGAEPGNYFTPGVLDPAFFLKRGYVEGAKTWNLEWSAAALPPLSGAAALPPHSRILDFIEREFGRIWRFEAAKAFERERPTIVVEVVDGELAGFAAYDVNNRGLGFFGPTGVKESMRGRGIGCRLLLASLSGLRELGHERVVIPWTDALEFYARCCGAQPAHEFVRLDSAP
jgi:GNAT superfamily N-acetyltransferase